MGDGVKSASDKLNYYAYSTIKAPDKGEVGGSSPPRPTIQITSKHAAILTFPLFGDLTQKTVLSTVCQLHVCPDATTLTVSRRVPCQVEGRAGKCTKLQGWSW